jgi:hypothetical protein
LDLSEKWWIRLALASDLFKIGAVRGSLG